MPSEKVLAMKQEVVADLAEELKSAELLVLNEYLGINVAQDTELRNAMRESGVTYKVVKNTILSRALEQCGLEGLTDVLKGSTAIAYHPEDPVSPAKILKQYSEKVPAIQIKGGAYEGEVVGLDYINQLASIPDLPVLYAKVVGGLASPLTGLALLLKAIADKMEEAGAETAAEVYVGPAESDDSDAAAEGESEDAESEAPAEATEEAVEEAADESAASE